MKTTANQWAGASSSAYSDLFYFILCVVYFFGLFTYL